MEGRRTDTRGGAGESEAKGGVLYLVATPLGNLEDITLRALRILGQADTIAAENVSHTRGLCSRFGIRARIVAFNEHTQATRGPELVQGMKDGEVCALVADAGTPGVSDPGAFLVRLAAGVGLRVVPIPGPSAVTAALSISGFDGSAFLFSGFLPNRRGQRRRALQALAAETRTMVFYEAPHRIREMLVDLLETFGDREMLLARELTKVFEECVRGPVSACLAHVEGGKDRGEFTLVVSGRGIGGSPTGGEASLEDLDARIGSALFEDRKGVRRVAEDLAGELGLPFRKVYRLCLEKKTAWERNGGHAGREDA